MKWTDADTTKLIGELINELVSETPPELLGLPGIVECRNIGDGEAESAKEGEDREIEVAGTGTLETFHHLGGGDAKGQRWEL